MDWKLRHSLLSLKSPKIMGILNVTPDSFSDPGRFFGVQAALDRAVQIQEEGADLLDIGAESSRPGAVLVDPEEEWRRLSPVLHAMSTCLKIPVSVDTRHAETARRALDCGVDAVNDISCAADEALLQIVADAKSGYVLMHSRGEPFHEKEKTRYHDLIPEIRCELGEGLLRARQAGLEPAAVIVDPGFGFAKTPEQNWILLRELGLFKELERPMLVGLSRKRFLREFVGTEEVSLISASIAAGWAALQAGAAILRVHDVAATRAALNTFKKAANQLQDAHG